MKKIIVFFVLLFQFTISHPSEILKIKKLPHKDANIERIYKLDNENFVDRAPKDVVAHEKNKRADYEQQLNKIQDNLQSLKD